MIAAVFTIGAGFRPRLSRRIGARSAGGSAPVSSPLPTLKSEAASPARKLPLRGRIWGTFLPPWPNYGPRRGRPGLLGTTERRDPSRNL